MNPNGRIRRIAGLTCFFVVSLVVPLPCRAAGSGSIRLTVRPEMLRSDGQSTATVSAEVRDSSGDRVPDGTIVRFTTTAGTIEATALTSAGTARVSLTSATLPDTAQISAVVAGASATIRLPMVSELPDLKAGGRIVRVQGKYVAYSENLRILEATDQARATYRKLAITARRLQIDLNGSELRAQGAVQVKGRTGTLDGERLFLNLRNLKGTLVSRDGRLEFQGLDPLVTPVPTSAERRAATNDQRPAIDDRRPTTDDRQRTTGEGLGAGETWWRWTFGSRSEARPHPPTPSPNAGRGGEGPNGSPDSPLPVLGEGPGVRAVDNPPSTERPSPGAEPKRPAPSAGSRRASVPNTQFDLVDLSESDMLWTAKKATAFLDDRVQLHGATAYWVGAKLLPLGNHEIPLDGSATGTDRYVGVGSEGLVVDLPYYMSMGAGGSTALRLRHADRNGFGYFAQRPGWQLDLERKYGEPGSVEGLFTLNRITGSDWGLRWNHNQPLGPTARLYSFVDYPAHREIYGQLNLNKQWGFATTNLSLSANKFRGRSLGHSVDFAAESRPWSLGGGFRLSLEGRVRDSQGGQYVRLNQRRFQVPGVTQQEFGLKLRPPTVRLGSQSSISSSFTTRQAWGSRQGLGFVGSLSFVQKLGGNNALTLNYNYNQTPGYAYLDNSGRQNLSATLFVGRSDRFRFSTFGLMGIDNPIRTLTSSASYAFTRSWRLDLQHTLYQFGIFNDSDTQIGIARALGPRELFLYWSTQRHRFAIEVGANNF